MNGLALTALGMAFATSATPGSELARLAARLDTTARHYVASGSSDGISIAVVRCERAAFVTAGRANRASRRRVTPDTPFEIGSVSKTLTALLLAQAVSEGRARVDDDVRHYLTGRYDNLLWSDGTPITLGELADTTSGLPDYLPDPAPIASLPAAQQIAAASKLLAKYSNADFLRDLHHVRLMSRPGSSSHHSNVAAQLLGYILGRIYAEPFTAVLAAKIERPAGLTPVAVPRRTALATGYDAAGAVAPPFGGESILPAGGLRYSGRDMARFLTLEIRRTGPGVELSQRVRFTDAPDHAVAFTWVRSRPRAKLDKFRMSGGTFGSSSYVEFYPALRYGIAVMANRAAGNTQDELQEIAETAFDKTAFASCPTVIKR